MEMSYTQITKDELKVFESLKDIKVVFDVGARDDVDYLIIKPGIELHAFEPDPAIFKELKINVGKTLNVYLNNFGLGDIEARFQYDGGQVLGKQLESSSQGGLLGGVLVRRLDNYIKEHNIKQIDFLKIDVEGYEPQVIKGLGDMAKICRYIQYEQGKNSSKTDFDRLLLESDFTLYYIGYRNVLGVKKGEPMPWIPKEPQEGGTPEKDESNYLRWFMI